MKTTNKPFTPFGAILQHILSTKIKLNYSPYFFCGRYAYEEAQTSIANGQIALCLPMGQALDDYSWPIAGLRLILFDTGSMTSIGLTKLAHGLLLQDAELVAIYSDQKRSTDVFRLKKDLQHGKGSNRR